jgi:phospholipid/cholesterol/gamma-HCH transport system permease protein
MIQWVGKCILGFIQSVGSIMLFSLQVLKDRPKRGFQWLEIVYQLYFVGVLSFGIIVVSGLFIGMVVSFQGFSTLEKFGAESQLGQLVALSVFRELGPVVSALLFAGRAGSALAAEIALMQVTEQIDCMQMMAIDPMMRILFPRFIAGAISLPLLSILFSLVAIWGGQFVAVHSLGIDQGSYVSNMKASVDFMHDVMGGIAKSVIFGILVVSISIYQGYHAERSARGIAHCSTMAVVYGSLTVLCFDLLLTMLI